MITPAKRLLGLCLVLAIGDGYSPALAPAQTEAPAVRDVHAAAKSGDLQALRSLLSGNPGLIDAPDDRGVTPLHRAAIEGRRDVVEYLISRNADIRKPDQAGNAALHGAAYGGRAGVVEVLLARGADVQARNRNGQTPLFLAAFKGAGDAAEVLLGKGADVDAQDIRGLAPLHAAAQNGRISAAEVLIAHKARIDIRDAQGYTPLFLAARSGRLDMTRTLREAGARVDAKNAFGMTPLHDAVFGDHADVVEYLLAQDAPPDEKDNRGVRPLDWALENGSVEVVRLFLDRQRDVQARKWEFGRTLLHQAAILGQKEIADIVLSRGADLNARDERNQSPLDLARISGREDMAQYLVSRGAAAGKREPLEATFVANEGFLITAGARSILIDALFGGAGYPGMPTGDVLENLRAARSPFDRVGLALATHGHPDHFDPLVAGKFLARNPKALLAGPVEASIQLALYAPEFPNIEDRIVGCRPEWGKTVELTAHGVRIKILGLRHADKVNFEAPHQAYLLELGGYRVLHLGDALPTLENFEPFAWLEKTPLDVVLMPEWFLRDPGGNALIDRFLKARRFVIIHINPGDEDRALSLAGNILPPAAETLVFRRPMEKKVLIDPR
jgi:ankyrin repeat protein/L-ascorbate metabolism protein UlaG (beta-lactamase superfamily)